MVAPSKKRYGLNGVPLSINKTIKRFEGVFYGIGCIDTSYICGIVSNDRYYNLYQNDISTKKNEG
jgi:hypothetical protein